MTHATAQAPKDASTEFARLFKVTHPSLDDLKIMAVLEASGEGFYQGLVDAAPNEEVRKLLAKNGQEETAHAHRLKKIIKLLGNEDYPLPELDENPFHIVQSDVKVTRQSLAELARGEGTGEALYETWASNVGNEEAARLLRLNGKEETGHQQRLLRAVELFG